MGGNQSIEKDLSEYKNNERIGLFRHVQIHGETFVEIVKNIPNEKVFTNWIQRVKNVKISMIGSDVVYLPVKNHYNKTELCGSGGDLKVVYVAWENFLKDEISNRRKIQNFYKEEEIWFIFYNLVKVGVLYQGNNEKLGDMHPNNVIVTPNGFIKVITRDSFPLQMTNFDKIIQEIKTDTYLAPEEMDNEMIESGVYSVKWPSKADVFSFGVTMLSTITLQNCAYMYIRNPLRISQQKLDGYVNIMRDKYSELLFYTILSVLQVNSFKRKGFLQLYETLRPFQQKILNLQPFQLMKPSPKGAFQKSTSQSRMNNSMNQSQKLLVKSPYSPPTQQPQQPYNFKHLRNKK